MTQPVLFLDIDRVAAPISDTTTWDDFTTIDTVHGAVPVSPRLLAAIGALPATVVYVTDWGDDAHQFDSLLGRTNTEVAARPAQTGLWWKLDAIDTWLTEHPQVTRFVHADDHLADDGRLAALATVAATHRCDHAAVVPEDGLTPTHLEVIRRFISG